MKNRSEVDGQPCDKRLEGGKSHCWHLILHHVKSGWVKAWRDYKCCWCSLEAREFHGPHMTEIHK